MNDWPPIASLVAEVYARKQTASDLVEQALRTIEAQADFKAIIAVTAERARSRAKDIDARLAKGEKVGRLAGVPFIAKDNFLAFGAKTTAASNILRDFNAPYQATVINRLEAEGAILVAKANLDAFGHGVSTEHSDFMITRNPHDKTRIPGGSSGGPAAAVVLKMVPFALGTDTGGSNRLPASYSGAVGYKPTYGLVSRSGVIAMASSTDTIGPLAMRVDDAALVLDVISGPDVLDGVTIDREVSYDVTGDDMNLEDITVGVVKEYMSDGVEADVKQKISEAVEKLKAHGANVLNVSLPAVELALPCYYILVPAEISSNLSRYDGQHFGFSHDQAKNIAESYSLSREKGFGSEAKRRIMIGTYVLSSGYYEAYYQQAQQLRTKLIEEFNKVFNKVDFLIGPVAPTTAFKIGANDHDPLKHYLVDIMTVSASLVGIPAISIPAGQADDLPVGLQIMAPQRHDRGLLLMAKKAEEVLV